jgi:hypothetical protein
MPATSLVLDQVLPHLAGKGLYQDEGSHIEFLLDPSNGREEGLLIESTFGRVVVVKQNEQQVSLADVGHIRHMMVRTRASRAILYIPLQAAIPNPVMLLATLSKIEIVRFGTT